MVSKTKRCTCPDHEGPNPLPLSEFYPARDSADGLSRWCRNCFIRTARRWRKENPERKREHNRSWYRNRPEKRSDKYRGEIRRQKQLNAASRDVAEHHYEPWTIQQLEVAAREDLTARQAAAMLGRTYWAVRTARHNIRRAAESVQGAHTEGMSMSDLWQAYLKSLASIATGQGGSADVITPALDKALAQGYAAVLAEPGVVIPPDQPDSDEPDPA